MKNTELSIDLDSRWGGMTDEDVASIKTHRAAIYARCILEPLYSSRKGGYYRSGSIVSFVPGRSSAWADSARSFDRLCVFLNRKRKLIGMHFHGKPGAIPIVHTEGKYTAKAFLCGEYVYVQGFLDRAGQSTENP